VGHVLYNILLKTHNVMMVNNMIAETLHPENIISKIYRATEGLNAIEKNKFIKDVKYRLYKSHIYSS